MGTPAKLCWMKDNPRITPKDRNAIKGALRRAFARSELHRKIIARTIVPTESVPLEVRSKRPRVKTWCICPKCSGYCAKSDLDVDHMDPLVPVTSSLADMTVDELVSRLWCSEKTLQAICGTCHDEKTAAENKIRKEERAKRESKRPKKAA